MVTVDLMEHSINLALSGMLHLVPMSILTDDQVILSEHGLIYTIYTWCRCTYIIFCAGMHFVVKYSVRMVEAYKPLLDFQWNLHLLHFHSPASMFCIMYDTAVFKNRMTSNQSTYTVQDRYVLCGKQVDEQVHLNKPVLHVMLANP